MQNKQFLYFIPHAAPTTGFSSLAAAREVWSFYFCVINLLSFTPVSCDNYSNAFGPVHAKKRKYKAHLSVSPSTNAVHLDGVTFNPVHRIALSPSHMWQEFQPRTSSNCDELLRVETFHSEISDCYFACVFTKTDRAAP